MDHSPHSPADPDKLRALIVDDEAPIREMVGFALERAGVRWLEAEDAATAMPVVARRSA